MFNRLVMLYKIAGGLVPAVDPDVYLAKKPKDGLLNLRTILITLCLISCIIELPKILDLLKYHLLTLNNLNIHPW